MKIAICDDEVAQLQSVKEDVEIWCKNHLSSFTILTFQSAEQLWMSMENSEQIDIYLLDIQMEGMNGMELAQKIRSTNEHSVILFISGVSDYVYDGFNVKALNYLLKPVKQEHLFASLHKAVEMLCEEEKVICLTIGKETRRLSLDKIIYIESFAHYVDIHYGSESLHCKMNLSQLEKQLPPDLFMQAHRSFIVNVIYVNGIQKKELRLKNGQSIPIARGRWEEVNEKFITFHKQRGHIL